jgi:hypothetical protein
MPKNLSSSVVKQIHFGIELREFYEGEFAQFDAR